MTSQYLPWKVVVLESGETEVFSISPDDTTLREFSTHFGALPEIRLFEKASGISFLEAYLGKVSVGHFEARLIAELEAPETLLKSVLALGLDRKPTPNNLWKYSLSEQQVLQALDLKLWRFMYIPIAAYHEKQINFFGKPSSIEQATETAEYRFFPEKGMVVLWDKAGKEIFYYTSPSNFSRLSHALEADKKLSPLPSAL